MRWGVVLLVFLAVLSAYFFWRYRQTQALLNSPRQQAIELANRVGRLIEMPADEVPGVATVTDPNQLEKTPFYAKAKKGMKVLIYPESQKAILYDPVADKIVEVMPLIMSSSSPTASTSGAKQ